MGRVMLGLFTHYVLCLWISFTCERQVPILYYTTRDSLEGNLFDTKAFPDVVETCVPFKRV
jgi:hypothetical protein